MTTKTDFQSIRELRNVYTPQTRGIVSNDERDTISRILELDTRSGIELCNVRDMAVMLYGVWSDAARKNGERERVEMLLDSMSAITYIIDREKWRLGIEP